MTPRWLRLVRRIVYCRRGHEWLWRRTARVPGPGAWYLECANCLSTTTTIPQHEVLIHADSSRRTRR